jgi:hypothetical protein
VEKFVAARYFGFDESGVFVHGKVSAGLSMVLGFRRPTSIACDACECTYALLHNGTECYSNSTVGIDEVSALRRSMSHAAIAIRDRVLIKWGVVIPDEYFDDLR